MYKFFRKLTAVVLVVCLISISGMVPGSALSQRTQTVNIEIETDSGYKSVSAMTKDKTVKNIVAATVVSTKPYVWTSKNGSRETYTVSKLKTTKVLLGTIKKDKTIYIWEYGATLSGNQYKQFDSSIIGWLMSSLNPNRSIDVVYSGYDFCRKGDKVVVYLIGNGEGTRLNTLSGHAKVYELAGAVAGKLEKQSNGKYEWKDPDRGGKQFTMQQLVNIVKKYRK
jgi:hypothetical protein